MRDPRVPPSVAVVPGVLVIAGLVAACMDFAGVTGPSSDTTASVGSSPVASTAPSVAPSLAATPIASDGTTAGETRTDAVGIAQVWVPAGTFTMGTAAADIAALEKRSPPP